MQSCTECSLITLFGKKQKICGQEINTQVPAAVVILAPAAAFTQDRVAALTRAQAAACIPVPAEDATLGPEEAFTQAPVEDYTPGLVAAYIPDRAAGSTRGQGEVYILAREEACIPARQTTSAISRLGKSS
ncbi:MAG: hypothetical protein K0R17_1256 [Rariglobus sp.]|jgi:hypothetical protein|nr:hypothetical protein [Rariglobus sp.]